MPATDSDRAPSSSSAAPPSADRPRSARAFAGHPVDVATGEQFTAAHDVEVPGVSPLIFRRVYNTAFLSRAPSVLGPGWVHAFEASLRRDLDGYVFEGHDGDRVEFDDVDGSFSSGKNGASIVDRAACMELRREGEQLVVYHWHSVDEPVQKYVFNTRDGDLMWLAARVLPSGHGLRIDRDRLGRALTITQTQERRRLYFDYDDQGRLSTLHLGFAAQPRREARLVARYEYDARSRLMAVLDAQGAARCYEYDSEHRLISERGRRGGVFRMRYDAQGRCVETSGDGDYRKCVFHYEPGRTTRVTDSLGFDTIYQYNAQGQVHHRILPNGAQHLTELDDYGRIVGEIDPLGGATRYVYDEIGRVAEKIFPSGAKIQYEYDEYHQPRRISEPDGAVWEFRYERGALVEVKDPFGRRTSYHRGPYNDLRGAATSSGQELRIDTDEHFTEETLTDQFGIITRRKLDLYLNAIESSDAEGPLGKAQYDALGRLIRSERPDGSARQFEYDAEGDLTRMTDARGGVWQARYTPYGDCVEQLDPLGRQHRFTWDTEGRLTSIVNPKGETASFEYDLAGNLVAVTHFDGSREQASYDLAARLTGRVRPDGTRLSFDRDEVGNLLKLSVVDREKGEVPLRSFKYDSCGSPLEAKSSDAQVLFEYAVGGRLEAEVQNGRRIEYLYDARGYLSQRSFEGSKAGPLRFEYDTRGRLRRFATQNGQGQTYDYDRRDQCIERTLGLPGGAFVPSLEVAPLPPPQVETRKYDLEGRLRHQSVGKHGSRTYQYDAEGSLIDLADQLRGRRQYRYDLADQLITSVSRALGQHGYNYDANGNLTGKDHHTLGYASGNRLEALRGFGGDTTFARNVNGELTRQTSAARDDQYTWDALGQLTSVLHRDGSVTEFAYDALGRRVHKEHRKPGQAAGNGRTTRYLWSGDDLLAEQTRAPNPADLTVTPGESLTEYAMWGFVAEALWEDGKIRHVVSSQQGVPQELIDEKGRLVWQGTYDDWGKLVAESGETTCRLRLPGQLADEETGLHYNRFRYYAPETGQFVSPDPIGYGRSKNRFRFAPNAIAWIDVVGLECWAHAAQQDGAKRRAPSPGDVHFPSREAALEEAARRHGIDPSTLEAQPQYGSNPNLVGPRGQPWERVSGLNANADIVTFDHHSNGHYFRDAGEYEFPHYHGPSGEHLTYEP
ncbi:MAG TPA: RHS repeat-associated core domain-containing protein [Polyangiaceae bacterium]|nr:RHS repeat-associated core domain-containing protein [Polyangiaceae bacterium]